MRTPLVLLALAAAALGPAATASAKEIAAVKVCGADGCRDVTDRATMALTDGGPPPAWPEDGDALLPGEDQRRGRGRGGVPGWSFLWVPAAEKMQFEDGTWTNPPSTAIDELKLIARDVDPLPASKLVLPEPAAAPAAAAAPSPSPPPAGGDGLPGAVWVLLAAGRSGSWRCSRAPARPRWAVEAGPPRPASCISGRRGVESGL